VQVELVIHDETVRGGGFFAALKWAIAIGFTGAGIAGVLGSLAGRGVVTWQETPSSLAKCRDAVQTAVDAALGNFLVVQLLALSAGFLLFAFAAFVKVRARQRTRAG
jgi:hypothetical protein